MIKLKQIAPPNKLTPEIVDTLTKEFIKTDKTVWKGHDISKTLLLMSHQKCCYCECDLSEESKYMEVEHFCHKKKYQLLVLEWSNLLPSCKRCNTTKGSHDVFLTPIIKPTRENPKEHLCYHEFRLEPKSILGKNTIDALNLNDPRRLVFPRFELAEVLKRELTNLLASTTDYDNGTSKHNHRKNRITNTMGALLAEAIPTAIYSAIMATILFKEPSYQQTKAIFIKNHLWTQEFQDLENLAESCALDLK
jgi:uncharacterized protein (TIGR02646 family)